MFVYFAVILAVAAGTALLARRQRLLWHATADADAESVRRAVALPEIYRQVMHAEPPAEMAAPCDEQPIGTNNVAWGQGRAHPLGSLAWLSVAGETAWTAAEVWHGFAQVNSDFYQAVSHLAGQQLRTIGDLHHYLSGYDHSILGDVPEGTVNMLQGHLAEQVVADHLTALGHHVVFPEHANQPGWDLLVDGHPFNVKDVADAGNLAEHLVAHPDVPVIVPDHFNGLADCLPDLHANLLDGHGVIVDHLLHHGAIVEQAHGGAEAVLGHVNAHFPFITVILSSCREAGLLLDGKTEIERSLRNVTLDAAGTGGGGLLGGKAGALLGTAILPGPGTVIGALLGALGGACAGRLGTNALKRAPLQKARSAYESAHFALAQEVARAASGIQRSYMVSVDEEEDRLRQQAAEAEARIRVAVKHAEAQVTSAAYLPADVAAGLLDETRGVLESEVEHYRSEMQKTGFWRRLLWPGAEAVRSIACHRVATVRLAAFRELVAQLSVRCENPTSQKELSPEAAHELCQIVLSFGCATRAVRQYLEAIKRSRSEQQAVIQALVVDLRLELVRARDAAAERLCAVLERLREDASAALAPHTQRLSEAEAGYRRELERNGIRLNERSSGG